MFHYKNDKVARPGAGQLLSYANNFWSQQRWSGVLACGNNPMPAVQQKYISDTSNIIKW